ncbi:xanthine dehydrogenase family protein molybdopterin-binding subunit [Thalassotalea sp. PS06]|uniref:xanthine dehydrogenase family protein molybdopterin-binding subunit n=1 Tax=Thalassotalea sp. PS06 TaxID=2594005 RepID=UPI001162926F|nr:molybdopterin cofactor-binding domain-containing protein [Thalassotalea sp. PS06]QDP01362.1 xanthine dehydrogenase family protein molybdopterin-binding subunit [Thalassotalea sp. PS06]
MTNISRRNFLKSAGVGTSGLMLGVSIPATALASEKPFKQDTFNPNAFIHLTEDGKTTIYCGRCEMGQGISTALPAAVADEMEADWGQVTVLQAEGNEDKYGPQATGGSASIRVMYIPMREAGAKAKFMLEAAAAKTWDTDIKNCYAKKHYVYLKNSDKKLSFGELASLAATMPAPEKPKLKEKSEYAYIGKDLKRHDQADVVVGQRTYGVDTKFPGLKYAAIVHCPVLDGKLKSVDKSAALAIKGVTDVVEIERLDIPYGSLGGVAVVADNSWTAQQGVRALKVEWEAGKNGIYDTKTYKKQLVANVEKPAQVNDARGDVAAALKAAKNTHSATYTGGHLSHSPMEPNASVVWVQDDSCEVWASTQSPADIQKVLAQFLKREPKDIKVNVMMAGGAFGRKFKCDYVHEAAAISQQVKAPVQLIWSREEDMRTGYYHSTSAQHIQASFDDEGNVDAWLQRVAFPSINSLFDKSVERAPKGATKDVFNHPFGIKNMQVESGEAPAHTRIGWYRAVYAIFYGFAFASFADELAHKAGMDPFEFLNKLYDSNTNPKQAEQIERSKGVLALAAEKSGYHQRDKLPEGQGIGLAVHYSFNSYVAMAVHVEVDGDNIKVLNVDCAVDCGQILNTDGATAQMEGAVVMGMSLSMYTEIVFKDGQVVNSNFHNYPVLRINEMPNVRVHLVDSDKDPTGLGEPGVSPFPPALTNAIFAASGKRYRDLPIKPMSI